MTATEHARRVLIVEDDRSINQALADRFAAEGFAVSQAWDGPGAIERFQADAPEVLVLDQMLPGFDGLEVCRRIQAERPVPVLMLTARDEEADILIGLSVGADDYLTKPFRMREVVARVQVLLRRVDRAAELARSTGAAPIQLGQLTIDVRSRTVLLASASVHLTPTEFDLLVLLAGEQGAVVRRERILTQLWGWDDALGSRTLDSHIKALRAKVGAHLIRTVHGVGYAIAEGDAQ